MSKRRGRPRLTETQKNKKPSDIITCTTCQGTYTRANRAAHNKTKQHQQALKYETILKNTLHQQIPDRPTLIQRAEYPYYDWNGERIYMKKNKFNYYNTVSMAKNGYPLYFNSLSERKKIMREQADEEQNENSTVIVPEWFVKKIDDPNTTRKELKKILSASLETVE